MRRPRLLGHVGGAAGAEFALVVPLLILMLFGIIDAGRWMYTYNLATKATQMGARMAVVSDYLSTAVGTSYVNVTCGGTTLTQGDSIPAGCFTNVTCNSVSCTGGSVAGYTGKFDAIYLKMHQFMPEIQRSNLTIEYTQSGLGYAGTPPPPGTAPGTASPDVAPMVTVRLSGMQFRPTIALGLHTMTMPDFHTSLTFEDGTGAQSN